MKIRDARRLLKAGMKIKTDGDGHSFGRCGIFGGTVKCVHERHFCVRRDDDMEGSGCDSTWIIFWDSRGIVEFRKKTNKDVLAEGGDTAYPDPELLDESDEQADVVTCRKCGWQGSSDDDDDRPEKGCPSCGKEASFIKV